ncbi:hypothetical protein GOODEAATRI_033956, partial [Goodea atripinnis]
DSSLFQPRSSGLMNRPRPRSASRKRTLLRSSQRCSPKRSCQTSWKSLCLCSIWFLFLLQFYVPSLHRNTKDREAPLHQPLHPLHHLSPQQTNHISNCFMKIRRERVSSILSDKLEEPVFVLDLVPVSPPVLCSQSSQKQKRQRSPSPTASTSSPPPVSPTDQPHLQLLH